MYQDLEFSYNFWPSVGYLHAIKPCSQGNGSAKQTAPKGHFQLELAILAILGSPSIKVVTVAVVGYKNK